MSFADDLKKASQNALVKTDEDRKAITIKLFNSVISDTPVDTGRARGNWQCSTGSPKAGELQRNDKSGSEAQSEVLDEVFSSPPDSKVYLTNNLPYAVPLEQGHSQEQAPHGMVRKNMARISQIVRETSSKK